MNAKQNAVKTADRPIIDLMDVLIDKLKAGEPVYIDLAPLQKLSQKEPKGILKALVNDLHPTP